MSSFFTRLREATRRTDTTRTQAESLAAVADDLRLHLAAGAEPYGHDYVMDVDKAEEAAHLEDADHGPVAQDDLDDSGWQEDLDEHHVDLVAADAADAGLNADHAAAYGSLHSGYEQARAEQAAARELQPGLTPAATAKVTAWEDHKNRPITLAEARWLQHVANAEATAATDERDHADQATHQAAPVDQLGDHHHDEAVDEL